MPQVQVHLEDRVYNEAKRRAEEAGFEDVDSYLADVLANEFEDDIDEMQGFFTPERLAQIDAATAQIKAGESYTMDEVREHFRKRFEG